MIGTGWKNTTISLHCNRDTPVPFAKGVWDATYGCWKAGAICNSAEAATTWGWDAGFTLTAYFSPGSGSLPPAIAKTKSKRLPG